MEHSARPSPRPPAPTPFSVNAIGGSSSAAASSRPWSPSPAPSCSFIWDLLANRAARYGDLGPGQYTSRIDEDRNTRNHVRQLEAEAPVRPTIRAVGSPKLPGNGTILGRLQK